MPMKHKVYYIDEPANADSIDTLTTDMHPLLETTENLPYFTPDELDDRDKHPDAAGKRQRSFAPRAAP